MGSKKRRSGVGELIEALAVLREFELPETELEQLLRDAEDGLELGLGAVPPAMSAKRQLEAAARVRLMGALTKLAELLRARSDETKKRQNETKAVTSGRAARARLLYGPSVRRQFLRSRTCADVSRRPLARPQGCP